VGDYLRRELAGHIQREMRDPRVGLVTVTEVEVTRDLAHARVYVTGVGRESEAETAELIAVLNDAAGFLRSRIAQQSTMRTTPKLKFVYDSSVLRGERLSSLIDRAVARDRESSDGAGDKDPGS
jgi:ribosome-binding factor A